MNGLYPVFKSRSFEKAIQPGLSLQVDKMTWDVQGGCRSARLVARVKGGSPSERRASIWTNSRRCCAVRW